MLLFGILYLIGIAVAQVPHRCTSPRQWEARVHSSNPNLDADLVGRLSYDSVYQRTRILQNVTVGQTKTYYDIISLYQAKLVFFIDMKSGNCSRYFFDQPWSDFGIQPDAKSLGEAYLGSSSIFDAGLLVTIWSGNQTIPINETASYIGTWTYEECLPVSNISFEPNGDTNYIRYYDVTFGINNPNVFIPPRQCLTEKAYPIRYTLFGPQMNNKPS